MWESEIADNYTMSRVVDFASAKDLQRRRRRNDVDPIIAEIVFALLECGGEAHRTTVAERVMRALTPVTKGALEHLRRSEAARF